MPVTTTPYTQELVIVHRVFRREAALLARLADGVRTGDTARAARIAAAITEYTAGLRHHTALEDELIWPKLYARARLYDELVHRMETQHARLEGTLKRIDEILPRWERTAAGHVRAALVEALHDHICALSEHLADEEANILPLITDHLTIEEWEEVGRRGQARMPLGQILEDATPEEQQHFLNRMPIPGRVRWHLTGRRRYRHHVDELRGGLR